MCNLHNIPSGENCSKSQRVFRSIVGFLEQRSEPLKPTLVGIELNPGPTPAAKIVGTAAVTLGGIVKQLLSKKKVAKTRKKKSNKSNKPKNISRVNSTMGIPMAISSVTSANNPLDGVIRMPFSGASINLKAVGASTEHAVNFFDGVNASVNGLDLNPVSSASHPGAFGLSIGSLCNNFTLFRIRRLRMEFISMLPTTTQGVIAFGYTPDAVDIAPTSVQTVASCCVNSMGPIWEPFTMEIPCDASASNWYYIYNSSYTTQSQVRQSAPGSIQCCYNMNGASDTLNLGYLRFTGEIEFKGLARTDLLGASSAHNSNSPHETKTPEIRTVSTTVTDYDMVDITPNSYVVANAPIMCPIPTLPNTFQSNPVNSISVPRCVNYPR